MATTKVSSARDAAQIGALLASPEIAGLITQLVATRWTGRPGYPVRAMVGLALVKSLYQLPTWTRTVALVRDHAALRDVLGAVPSTDACYRFTVKLAQTRRHARRVHQRRDRSPARRTPGDGPDRRDRRVRPSRLRERPALRLARRGAARAVRRPGRPWGHRSSISTRSGGGYYGYKVHAAVCTATGLPVAWQVETARDSEMPLVPALLDRWPSAASPRRSPCWTGATTPRRLRDGGEPRHPAGDPAAADPRRQGWQAQAPVVRARYLDVRRFGPQARREPMALPDWRMPARVGVGQGQPAPHTYPQRHRSVETSLPPAGRGRARIRQAQERMGHAAASGAAHLPSPVARGSDHPGATRQRAHRHARHVGLPARNPPQAGTSPCPDTGICP